MCLSRRPRPFDSEDHLFELKIDGYRSLAYIESSKCRLVSRNGNVFRGFTDLAGWIGDHLRVESAVLDGEIACVDEYGRSVFEDLLFRRRECIFFAFDLLFLNNQDMRDLPLIERKARLRKMLRRKKSRIFYVDHVETQGRALSRSLKGSSYPDRCRLQQDDAGPDRMISRIATSLIQRFPSCSAHV